ncbi:hypothetical protein SAMN02910262_00963 [[Clostridium] aminophilum]|uniref:Uncharacterized protein n=1 Tax=[Clostridium] aminophilum TaxID=1526 RepID=A0A1I6IY02_9FIRM|nr:hypothetical protein SAMN02910262_00963 [[Clostridium] aminophilum]
MDSNFTLHSYHVTTTLSYHRCQCFARNFCSKLNTIHVLCKIQHNSHRTVVFGGFQGHFHSNGGLYILAEQFYGIGNSGEISDTIKKRAPARYSRQMPSDCFYLSDRFLLYISIIFDPLPPRIPAGAPVSRISRPRNPAQPALPRTHRPWTPHRQPRR